MCSVCKSDIVNFFTFKEKSKRTDTVLKTTLLPKTPPTASIAVVQEQNEVGVSVEPTKYEKPSAVPSPVPIKSVRTVSASHPTPIKMEITANVQPPPLVEEESPLNDYHQEQEEPDTTEVDADDDDLIFNCEVCVESFDTLDGLKNHCEATHVEVNSIERHNIKEEVIIDDDVDVGSVFEDNPDEHYEGEEEEDEEVIDEDAYVGEEYTEIDQLDDVDDELQPESYANNKKLQIHIKTQHETQDDEMDVDSEQELHIANQNEFNCILCDISFVNRGQLVEHFNEMHEHFCEECAVVYVSEDELLWHNVEAHKPQKPKSQKTPSRIPAVSLPEFRCSHCDKNIRGQLKFDQHIKLHDSMNVINNYCTFFPCHLCHIIFLTETEGNVHQTFHEENDNKPAIDTSCTDYQFLDEDGYDDGAYSCGKCSALLPNAADAKFHLVSHSAVFTCPYDVCGCQYDNFGRYTSHIMNKHVNGQDHRCSHCGQQLNSFDELQAHMKLQCSERKFACNHCGKFKFLKLFFRIFTFRKSKFISKILIFCLLTLNCFLRLFYIFH